MTLHVPTSNIPLSLSTFFPSGYNPMVRTPLFPSRKSSPICSPLFKFHNRSEPSLERVIIRYPRGKFITSWTHSVCPSNFWRGFIVAVSCLLSLGEDTINYLAQLHLSFHPTTKFNSSPPTMFLRRSQCWCTKIQRAFVKGGVRVKYTGGSSYVLHVTSS
ncbi:hypothetical protein BDR06DRAFT_192181 [Suillus hirtellus]|nr:hypothetical protein BDR06DRAFT_192181 [Suillus hirtellus]